nr:EVE domain-containing protein [Deltaproteobacteria bacterium]
KGNKRRVYKYFEEVKPGDIILGYISSPTKEIVGLCEVTNGLHESAEGEGFEFKKIEQFGEPVSLHEIQTDPELKDCEPLKNNQGSLFKLTKDEFEIIRAIIDEKNPSSPPIEPYSIEKALETVFLEKKHFRDIVDLLNYKKNGTFPL